MGSLILLYILEFTPWAIFVVVHTSFRHTKRNSINIVPIESVIFDAWRSGNLTGYCTVGFKIVIEQFLAQSCTTILDGDIVDCNLPVRFEWRIIIWVCQITGKCQVAERLAPSKKTFIWKTICVDSQIQSLIFDALFEDQIL